jgi:hypothetical protein
MAWIPSVVALLVVMPQSALPSRPDISQRSCGASSASTLHSVPWRVMSMGLESLGLAGGGGTVVPLGLKTCRSRSGVSESELEPGDSLSRPLGNLAPQDAASVAPPSRFRSAESSAAPSPSPTSCTSVSRRGISDRDCPTELSTCRCSPSGRGSAESMAPSPPSRLGNSPETPNPCLWPAS